jgi:hypothetical protein
MKTLISLLSLLALIAGAIQIDYHQLDAGSLFAAAAAAALFAPALLERRTARRTPLAPLARFPVSCHREVTRSTTALGLAA